MKRRLLIVAVFLLAGAVVNVGVAWGCAVAINIRADHRRSYSAPPTDNGSIITLQTTGAVLVRARRDNDGSPFVFTPIPPDLYSRPVVPDWAHAAVAAFGRDPILWGVGVDGRGWPMISLWSTYIWGGQYSDSVKNEGTVGIALPPFEQGPWPPRVLPIRPAWFGFANNTLFYAAILWLLGYSVLAVRRFIRVKRGLCPKCAYPMSESGVCSECGEALPGRARVAT